MPAARSSAMALSQVWLCARNFSMLSPASAEAPGVLSPWCGEMMAVMGTPGWALALAAMRVHLGPGSV